MNELGVDFRKREVELKISFGRDRYTSLPNGIVS